MKDKKWLTAISRGERGTKIRAERVWTIEFALRGCARKSLALGMGEEKRERRVWVSRALVFLARSTWNGREAEELEFICYMECTTPVDNVSAFLGFVCVR